ncbi:hypothetical protein FB45DRAFT_941123 [Roridomyces roridus]|uniref:AMP-dependent synthetase/ligase domain-containing protein n=1 Tax=Roridomyces roridus TaxID=1738132 RepID=A0AAD7B6Z8_9AGAR|nr:hypothetical protein FB45DRAFT_941123 [Roridomyces roridus]
MHPQGTNSPTFTGGPVDGSLTIPQLIELQLEQSPKHLAFIYDDPNGDIVSIAISQYALTVRAAAKRFLRDNAPQGADGKPTVVGLLANTDSLSFFSMCAGVMRAGMHPFNISPRNSASSLAHLLKETNAVAVYVTGDLRPLVSEALAIHGGSLRVFDFSTFESMQGELDAAARESLPPPPAVLDSTAVVLHSSGSTSTLSTPLYVSHRLLLQYANTPLYSNEDRCGQILGSHTLPTFHATGLFLQSWPFTSGLTIAVPRPAVPYTHPTAADATKAMLATKPDLVTSTPSYIESWSEDPTAIKVLQSLKGLQFVGAMLSKRVGDALISQGVVLSSGYGSMEIGVITPFFEFHGKDWEYVSFREGIDFVTLPEDNESGLYTHTYLVGPQFTTALTNSEIDRRKGCAISDLLQRHPEKPHWHRVYGRKDDLITFYSGFSMNPVPVEAQLNRNPFVESSVVFGHLKSNPGIIVQLRPAFRSNNEKREEILESIWAAVHIMNKESPTHCRIPKECIILANPAKPFSLTSKSQPRRRVVVEQYRVEIDSVYN